jgi:xylose isomerase
MMMQSKIYFRHGLRDTLTETMKEIWRTDPLLDNARSTHAASNTAAVFSVVRAATVATQRAINAAKNTGSVFSVWGPTRGYITGVSRRKQSGQGGARHRKYKRLKLGGGQAYNRSSD